MIRAAIVLVCATSVFAWAQEAFRYPVERKKLFRTERGLLVIDSSGVAYDSENGKRSIRITFLDIHEADISDPREIRIQTYDTLKRKLMDRSAYTFRLREVRHGPELARFLSASLARPVVGFQDLLAQGDVRDIPAYHRHRFGGCHGTLRFDTRGVQYVSHKTADSRTWLYAQLETVGSMNAFHFRVSTIGETYNFDLKEKLPGSTYDLAFRAASGIAARETPK